MTSIPHHNGHSPRRRSAAAFKDAAEPGLFDRPDRALAALRSLAIDSHARSSDRLERLAALLRTDADARFWTEESMREYVGLVNDVLDELGHRLRVGKSDPARLGVKCSNRSSGRYTLFRLRFRPSGTDTCRRQLPGDLSLSDGPS